MKRGGGRQGEEGKKMMKNNANARVAATGREESLSFSSKVLADGGKDKG